MSGKIPINFYYSNKPTNRMRFSSQVFSRKSFIFTLKLSSLSHSGILIEIEYPSGGEDFDGLQLGNRVNSFKKGKISSKMYQINGFANLKMDQNDLSSSEFRTTMLGLPNE